MSTEISFILTSSALLADFQNAFDIQRQEISCGGWEIYHTDSFNIWFCEEGTECRIPEAVALGSESQAYVIDKDFKKLERWSDSERKTIWFNPTNQIPSTQLPNHDYEICKLGQLEDIQRINQSPSLTQCLSWWKEWDLPENVRRHVKKVAWAAYALAVLIRGRGVNVNPILTHRGGLLHDLDKIKTLGMVNSHGNIGASFLDIQGYPAAAEIVRGHILHTILDPISDSRPWEVKLVYFCDKLTEGDEIVPLEERFSALGKRYPAYMKKMERAKEHIWELNNEICSLLSIQDNDHLVSLLNTISENPSMAQ